MFGLYKRVRELEEIVSDQEVHIAILENNIEDLRACFIEKSPKKKRKYVRSGKYAKKAVAKITS